MSASDHDNYIKIVQEATLEYFKKVMADCRDAGKTNVNKEAKNIVYYNNSEKEWLTDIMGSNQAYYADYITGNLNKVLTEQTGQ